jgi:hypothetical protein
MWCLLTCSLFEFVMNCYLYPLSSYNSITKCDKDYKNKFYTDPWNRQQLGYTYLALKKGQIVLGKQQQL